MTVAKGINAEGGTYEVGTAVPVRSFHTMAGDAPPEGVRHWHDYRLEARVRRRGLDERGMVVDLDLLDAALRAAAGEVAGNDLEGIVCPGLGAGHRRGLRPMAARAPCRRARSTARHRTSGAGVGVRKLVRGIRAARSPARGDMGGGDMAGGDMAGAVDPRLAPGGFDHSW